MNIEKLDEMFEKLVYLFEYHTKHLEEKELQLGANTELRVKWILQTSTQDFQFSIEKALQQMKEGEK